MPLSPETCRAVIYGLACGDALGKDTEFMNMAGIYAAYGSAGIRDLSQTRSCQFTDDTQMTVAVAEGILDSALSVGRSERAELMADEDEVMPWIAKRFVAWAYGPKNDRAPGNTCMAGCRALRDGKPWDQSGVTHSKGCGGMMRAAPVGLVYDDAKTVSLMAGLQSEITHGHPASTQAAQLTAKVVWALGSGKVSADDILTCVRLDLDMITENPDPKLVALLDRVADALKAEVTTEDPMRPSEVMVTYERHPLALGESWHGDEAFASALYSFLLAHQRGEGYVEAVRYGANTVGDSDSIAAVAGAFAGACWGLGGRGVPQDWIDQIEDTVELGELADRLAAISL